MNNPVINADVGDNQDLAQRPSSVRSDPTATRILQGSGEDCTQSQDRKHVSVEPAWVKQCSTFAPEWKRAIAEYSAIHLIDYGDVIQLGSGTTFNAVMDRIIERQLDTKIALDLIILTSNLQVMAKGRDAQSKYQGIFGTMQIILTGGALQMSLDSLTGEYAAKGVSSESIYPKTTFFGARGLSFRGELTIRYQFEEEISTQVAYATRPTERRVLLCDHTKLGTKGGWKAGLTIESLLSTTDKCFVISTLPDDNSEDSAQAIKTIEEEEQELRSLLSRLLAADSAGKYAKKEFALRLLDIDGNVKRETSLSMLRDETSEKGARLVRSSRR
jgi:DeoR/GlpR family transcriptional regulator of sugar metabolism